MICSRIPRIITTRQSRWRAIELHVGAGLKLRTALGNGLSSWAGSPSLEPDHQAHKLFHLFFTITHHSFPFHHRDGVYRCGWHTAYMTHEATPASFRRPSFPRDDDGIARSGMADDIAIDSLAMRI